MTLEFVNGDIMKAEVEALVNPVNCVGVMGAGLALRFKQAYPVNHFAYMAICGKTGLHPGEALLYMVPQKALPHWIINVATKADWREPSRIEYVQACLGAIVQVVKTKYIKSVAIPALGCGLGRLDWDDVKPRIEATALAMPDVRVLAYAPREEPEAEP